MGEGNKTTKRLLEHVAAMEGGQERDSGPKGTIAVAFNCANGIVAYVDSRLSQINSKLGTARYTDTATKNFKISESIMLLGVGAVKNIAVLVRYLQNELNSWKEKTGERMSVKLCMKYAREWAKRFLIKYPKNKTEFGGIMIGILGGEAGREKFYVAETIYVSKKYLRETEFLLEKPVALGSFHDLAIDELEEKLDPVSPRLRTIDVCLEAIKCSSLIVYLHTESVGGPLNVFYFRDGFEMDHKPYEVLQPLQVHVEMYRDVFESYGDVVVLLLVEKDIFGEFNDVERTFNTWEEIYCPSRAECIFNKFLLFRLFCRAEEDAPEVLRKLKKHSFDGDRHEKLNDSFSLIKLKVGDASDGRYIEAYVGCGGLDELMSLVK